MLIKVNVIKSKLLISKIFETPNLTDISSLLILKRNNYSLFYFEEIIIK